MQWREIKRKEFAESVKEKYDPWAPLRGLFKTLRLTLRVVI